MNKETLLVLCGGRSGEHEVSLRSARYIASCINKDRYTVLLVVIGQNGVWYRITEDALATQDAFPYHMAGTERVSLIPLEKGAELWTESGNRHPVDLAFPVLHGAFGEDGTLQGYLDMIGIPYVGCGTTSAALCMDKHLTKSILSAQGIAVVPYVVVSLQDPMPSYDHLCTQLGSTTLFVKPANQGSSLGVEKVSNATAYHQAITTAFLYGTKVLVEKAVEAREIECSVLGHRKPQAALHLGEICPRHAFYTYEAKYLDPEGAELIVPAVMPLALSEKIRSIALTVFQKLECSGLARVDFLVTEEEVYVNEINTMPGFTSISLYPKLWEVSGLSGPSLIQRFIDIAHERFAETQNRILDASAYLHQPSLQSSTL